MVVNTGRALTQVAWSLQGDLLALVGPNAPQVQVASRSGEIVCELQGLPLAAMVHTLAWDATGSTALVATSDCVYFANVRHSRPWAWWVFCMVFFFTTTAVTCTRSCVIHSHTCTGWAKRLHWGQIPLEHSLLGTPPPPWCAYRVSNVVELKLNPIELPIGPTLIVTSLHHRSAFAQSVTT